MAESYQTQEIVVPTPKETTIIQVDDAHADQIVELIEKALLQTKAPFESKGDSISLHLMRQGNPPPGP